MTSAEFLYGLYVLTGFIANVLLTASREDGVDAAGVLVSAGMAAICGPIAAGLYGLACMIAFMANALVDAATRPKPPVAVWRADP